MPQQPHRFERVLIVCKDFATAAGIDLEQWLALSGDERLAIGEEMRREAYGDHEQGLQRVLRVAERSES